MLSMFCFYLIFGRRRSIAAVMTTMTMMAAAMATYVTMGAPLVGASIWLGEGESGCADGVGVDDAADDAELT